MFTFLQISDTHILPGDDPPELAQSRDNLAWAVADINARFAHAAFVVHTGDIAGQAGEPEALRLYAEIAAPLALPVHYVLGNHDRAAGLREVLLRQAPSDEPHTWRLEREGWCFAALEARNLAVDDAQLAWLDALLAQRADRPHMIFVHPHALPLGVSWEAPWMMRNGLAFLGLVARHPNAAFVVHGHMHMARTLQFGTCRYIVSPSLAFQFSLEDRGVVRDPAPLPGYRVFEMGDDGSVTTWVRRRGAGDVREAAQRFEPRAGARD